ncbi:MAG: MmcQ/YjbR family DNA-binding protein [Myxococcota bacterium]
MDIESIRTYCLDKPGTTETFPFGDEVLVFKVMDKMYLLTNLERVPLSVNLKCEPAKALDLRAQYDAVQPGYHMNKKHWNTVTLNGDVPSPVLQAWIDDSYALVVSKLRKSDRDALAAGSF